MFNKQVGFQASSKISLSRKYDKNEASGKSKAKVDPNFKNFDQTFFLLKIEFCLNVSWNKKGV